MGRPTLNDVKLFLRDLLTKRSAHLAQTKTWLVYESSFQRLDAQVSALPASAFGPAAQAAELAAADALHDGRGAAAYHYLEAVLRSPDVSADAKASAKHLRDTFVPTLATLRAPYAD